MSELEQLMTAYRRVTIAEMRAIVAADAPNPDELHQLLHYHLGWLDSSFQAANASVGKMIRPILALLVCEVAGGDYLQAVPAAAAIELLHNFSLIHDDIEDGSPSRRGRDTVWKIWGEPKAINVGDAMFAYAQLAMLALTDTGIGAAMLVEMMRRFNDTCIGLTQGQHSDMCFETRSAVSVEDYVEMIRGKTALLAAFSAEIGARIAGADETTIDHYRQYGLQLGLAFQIIDDLLGVWGNEGEIGKSAESDILTKKKTYPILYGLTHSSQLRAHFEHPASSPNFVAKTIELLDAVDARQHTEAAADAYSQAALAHLEAARPTGPATDAIHQLTEILLSRTS